MDWFEAEMNKPFPPRPFCDIVSRTLRPLGQMFSGRVSSEEETMRRLFLLGAICLVVLGSASLQIAYASFPHFNCRAPIIVSN
jgi:hypothetical protein